MLATLWEWFTNPTIQALLSVAVLMVLVYFGIVGVLRLRPSTSKADTSVEDLAANFEEMRLEGELDETELRKIQTVLGKTQAKQTDEN